MNAAIRAVVRTAIYHGAEACGIRRGYQGLIEGDVRPLPVESVSGIINRGGTILLTARSQEFMTEDGQRKASDTLARHGIEGLVVIGGDGSYRGAKVLSEKWSVPTIGVPGSIDNDIAGTDCTIGFSTAVNTALDAIDKIRDTAHSHERIFVVEVMGRARGAIALEVGLAGGAEAILIPELPYSIEKVNQKIIAGGQRGKKSCIIVVAEGAARGEQVAAEIEKGTGYQTRVTVLGHVQRGGSPASLDRVLASQLGSAAVNLLMQGQSGKMVGVSGHHVTVNDLEYAWTAPFDTDRRFLDLAEILSI
ncbi:MAG: 6-phosphofructokinase [Armatimonadetes bacterium]|nr:6-phosphofructokinase [Armatimonadota bacterium]